MTVIQYHPAYLKRLANVYLDVYEMHGFKEAKLWYSRTTAEDRELRELLQKEIKEQAPKRGKVVKE